MECFCKKIFGCELCKQPNTSNTQQGYHVFSNGIQLLGATITHIPDCWLVGKWIKTLKLGACGIVGELNYLPPLVEYVSLTNNQITAVNLIPSFCSKNIINLDLSKNPLTSINLFVDVKYLNCCSTPLSSITLFTKVEQLYCGNCSKLSQINLARDASCTLAVLNVRNNSQNINLLYNISESGKQIPNNFHDVLVVLESSNVNFSVDRVNLAKYTKLLQLCLNNTGITHLDNIPPNLKELKIVGNNIEKLPTLPKTLTMLNCSGNQLNEISALPPNMNILYCSGNRLKNISSLPPNMNILYCSANLLTTLDLSSCEQLEEVVCYCNPLDLIVLNRPIQKLSFNFTKKLCITPFNILVELYDMYFKTKFEDTYGNIKPSMAKEHNEWITFITRQYNASDNIKKY
jgi:hypothetical protein